MKHMVATVKTHGECSMQRADARRAACCTRHASAVHVCMHRRANLPTGQPQLRSVTPLPWCLHHTHTRSPTHGVAVGVSSVWCSGVSVDRLATYVQPRCCPGSGMAVTHRACGRRVLASKLIGLITLTSTDPTMHPWCAPSTPVCTFSALLSTSDYDIGTVHQQGAT